VSIGRLSGVGALWDCVPRVCGGGGGCAGGGVPLGAVPVLSWCGEVSLGGIQSSSADNTHNNNTYTPASFSSPDFKTVFLFSYGRPNTTTATTITTTNTTTATNSSAVYTKTL